MPESAGDNIPSFDALPKTRHWLTYSQRKHPEATPDRIMETINQPDFVMRQTNGRTAYLKFRPQDDYWFRVVLDMNGSLRTAFRDDYAMRMRGRP